MASNKVICFAMPYHISEMGGGAEVQAWLYAKELAKIGFEVHYICQSINKKKIYNKEIIEKVTIHWIRYHKYFDILGVNDFIKEINNINPDIVVQRMTNFLTGKLSDWSTNNGKIFIWICTDNEIPYKYGLIKKYLLKRKKTANPYYWVKWIMFLLFAFISDLSKNKGILNSKYVLTQNDHQFQMLIKNFSKYSSRIKSGHEKPMVIINSYENFKNRTIIWVGNLGQNKRPELFIKLAKKMSHQKDINFTMIGGGYKNNVDFLSIGENMKYLGKLSFEENLKSFNHASLLVNTSLTEGFSNTFIQAWLRGIPVLTLNVDPDNIISINNLGVVANNINEMQGYIETFLSDYSYYKTVSDNCINYSESNHLIDIVVNDFCKFLN